jgi:hypothetical protein
MRAAERPSGSWEIAMTAGLLRMDRDLAEIVRRSFPIRRGDCTTAHIEKCALYYFDVNSAA